MTENDFLPSNYTAPVKQSNYYKLQDGENKIRVMSSAITWYQDWDNKKPINTMNREPAIDPTRQPKHFWAFIVWDYATSSLKCWQVTQGSIREQIENYVNDEDFGNPKWYDLKIKRTGKDLETKYSVTPWKVQPVAEDIQAKFDALDFDLDEIYLWGDVIKWVKDESF